MCAARRHQMRHLPAGIEEHRCTNHEKKSAALSRTTRTPSEARPPRMEPLARLPVFLALAGRRAVVAGGTAPAAWKAELLVGRRRRGRGLCGRARARSCRRSRPMRRAARSSFTAAPGKPPIMAGAAIAVGACDGRRRGGAFRRRGARRRRAGQCHRQAGVLRLLLRRHRQPLAAGDRHLDRRRCAGVRPGDPRQARSADPARLRALGRSRAPLARRA